MPKRFDFSKKKKASVASILEKLLSKKIYPYINTITLLGDLILLNCANLIAIYIRWGGFKKYAQPQIELLTLMLNVTWVLILLNLDVFKAMRTERISTYIKRIVNAYLLHFFIIGLLIFTFKLSTISRLQIMYFYATYLLLVFAFRVALLLLLKYFRSKGYNYRTLVFCGWNNYVHEFYTLVKKDPSLGYHVLGYFDDETTERPEIKNLGNIQSIKSYLASTKVDELFLYHATMKEKEVEDLLAFCDEKLTRLRLIPNIVQFTTFKNFELLHYGHLNAFSFRKEPQERIFNRFIKRIFDLVFSLAVVLLLLSWLFPIVALLIKLTSKGPVFFKQMRSGKDNHNFNCYKFRTMQVNNFADIVQAKKGDARITKVGAFLRKTSIDELPQFLNVIIGNMSVVGPRPHMVKHTEEYSSHINDFMVRHYLRPGITGWAQINGYRGETKKLEDMTNRVKYDIWYLENWTFWLDLKIIFLTITRNIVNDKKAY